MIYLLTKYFLSFANYEDNDDEIEAHNKVGNSFALGHNEFSHWVYSCLVLFYFFFKSYLISKKE